MDAALNLVHNPSWDMIAFFVLMACGFFWGVSYGKKSLSMVIVGVYVLFSLWPFVPANIVTANRAPVEILAFRVGIFIALLMLLLLFMFRTFRAALNGDGVWWEILIFSILGAGFLVTIFLGMAPAEVITTNQLGLSQLALQFFSNSAFTTWWMVLPILGVLFL